MTPTDPWLAALAIAAATLASEDLTCIATGLLAAAGGIDPLVGVLGCFAGIFIGDMGLWLVGRAAGRGLIGRDWVARRLPARRLQKLGAWLDRHCARAAVAARFLPGTRLPLYLAAGALSRCRTRFVVWTFVAGLAWTPLLVLSVALLGDSAVGPLQAVLGSGWLAVAAAAGVAFAGFRVLTLAASRIGRAKLAAAVARLWRWEFWPACLFYAPVVPWLLWLGLRHRGLTVWTAANPGIPAGGVVGESKHAILANLPPDCVIPSLLIPPVAGVTDPGYRPRNVAHRLGAFRSAITARGWTYPLVFKPDAAQRGAGVKRVRDEVEAEKYLQHQPAAVLVQPYHPGPFETGVFYYRIPGEPAGRIFSVTDKVFPAVTGDGHSTLAELVWAHPRYRMQARVFLARHAADADRVLGAGERFPLALAGNHCQGTLFRDGAHLITPALERAVDAIAQTFPGFFIGRFDIRYTDVLEFKAGRGLAVVELNGVTSESTNVYDPARSLLAAYQTLYRQWALAFRIGSANRRLDHAPVPAGALLRGVIDYYRHRRIDPLAD
jgi:membrane protein DedA with SNARE-associated domain